MKFKSKYIFDKCNVPLFRLKKDGRTSHLFGSCHVVPIYDLTLNNSLFKLNHKKEDTIIIDFLKNRQTLITEPGNIFKLSNTSTKEEILNNAIKYSDIINEPNFYKRFVKLYQNSNNDKLYNSKLFSLTGLLKKDKIYEALTEIINSKPNKKISNIGLLNVARGLRATLYVYGIDYHLIHHYTINNREIYGLDPFVTTKMTKNLNKYISYSDNAAFILSFILSKLSKKNIVDELQNIYNVDDYLYKSWNQEKFITDKIIVDERNIQWMPYILQYHNELDDPLFVVGAGHLNGPNGLIKLLKDKQFEIEIFNIPKRDFISLKNLKY